MQKLHRLLIGTLLSGVAFVPAAYAGSTLDNGTQVSPAVIKLAQAPKPEEQPKPVIDRDALKAMRATVRDIAVTDPIVDYVVRLVEATHPNRQEAPDRVRRYVRYGASPRGAQSLLLAAKTRAAMDGRFAVAAKDVRAGAKPALRHRIILGFEGEADGVDRDSLLDDVLSAVKE